jgi:hypothetical protein
MIDWIYDDGGRAAAGYRGSTGDCAVRAIAIVGEYVYGEIYDDLSERMGVGSSPRNGVPKKIWKAYVREVLGWSWTPTMHIGSGCTVHLATDELPAGRLLVSTSRHLVAVVDGAIRDTHDPSREGKRCVYGYHSLPLPTL